LRLTPLDLLAMGIPLGIVLVATIVMRRYMRSVADFLAANRCAGRYVICTSLGAAGSSVLGLCMALEVFSKTGFSMNFWTAFTGVLFFFFGILGLVSYRFRETRALTFHQFFEVRYTKGVRVFAGFLNVFSGIFNFGLEPAVGARFFVYFCGLPPRLPLGAWLHMGAWQIPTFVPLMIALMAASLCFALTGGQISVMVTDCLEGMVSSIFYLIIAACVICTVSVAQMRGALLSGSPGASYIDPFDIGSRSDFNGWYVLAYLMLSLIYYRGNSWAGAFSAAAKNAHEGRMAGILGTWRTQNYLAMAVLVSIAAFTVLHSPDFAPQAAQVTHSLTAVEPQLQTQMRMPTALGLLLVPGVRGCFLGVLLFGLLGSQGLQMHSFGSTFLQDVILPLRKKPLSPKMHIFCLRLSLFFVGAFAVTFSIIFKPVEYLQFITQLIGAIYLGGIGMVVWGGLYWKKGTSAGAWTSLILGGSLGVGGNLVHQFWTSLAPAVAHLFGHSALSRYLLAHGSECPLNGLQISAIIAVICAISYIVVSLATCRMPFNMDALLHRGAYRVAGDGQLASAGTTLPPRRRSLIDRIFDIDEHSTRGDKVLTFGTFGYTMCLQLLAVGILIWTLAVGRLSPNWWFNYYMVTAVWLTLAVATGVAIWFSIGVTRDLRDLFRTLKTAQRNAADDGTVRAHHNLGDEIVVPLPGPSPAAVEEVV